MSKKWPTCKKTFSLNNYDKDRPESLWEENRYFPFCGKRCKSIDLLSWLKDDDQSIEDLLYKDEVNETMGNT